ncbi:MAG: Crp/Fnr family transcriptional regulator [Bacteroidales bacterium]|nr:Crp/Fnr family transcriptional regulator [Bacteroidales bacterium]
MSNEELGTVRENRLSVVFNKGEIIRKQGTHLSHIIVISTGLAKVYIEGSNGKNSIINIVKPVTFVGGPGIFLDQIHHYSIAALIDTRVCFIDINVFKHLIDTNKQFANNILKNFSQMMLNIYNRLINLTQKQMAGRMADALIYLFDDIFVSSKIDSSISKQDLAELSGMAKESAVKILRDFHNAGYISISDNEILLLNSEVLKRVSRTG